MGYVCDIKEMPAQPALAIRVRAKVEDLPKHFGEVYGKIFGYLGQIGEQPGGMPYAGYYNMDMQDLDVEIGVPTTRRLEGQGDIQSVTLPGGKMATCRYTGSYANMEEAYNGLARYMQEQGLEPTGVSYEAYLNSPEEVPVDQLVTDIWFPVK